MAKYFVLFPMLVVFMVSGCTVAPPSNPNNLCEIFREKDNWYDAAADASEEWGSPIPVMMSMMYQESRYQQKVKPPRKMILGFIPGFRPSDAYGYSQAKRSTWDWYQRSSGNYGADRDDFDDAIDFIGWYNYTSKKRVGIGPDDTYRLYLAYHEGHGGFARGSFNKKPWLKAVAKKVSVKSRRYSSQLASCETELKRSGWFFGLF